VCRTFVWLVEPPAVSPALGKVVEKLKRQQSSLNLSSKFVKPIIKTIEPISPINEPVKINGEAARETVDIVKPTPAPTPQESPRSAFASNNTTAPSTPKIGQTPTEASKSSSPKKQEFKNEITPMRSPSPFKDFVKSISPTPELVPWLKSGSQNPTPIPTTAIPNSLIIPSDGKAERRSSSPRITIETNEFGSKVVAFAPESPPLPSVPNSVEEAVTRDEVNSNSLSPDDLPNMEGYINGDDVDPTSAGNLNYLLIINFDFGLSLHYLSSVMVLSREKKVHINVYGWDQRTTQR
jgi:hypothetical protein